MLSYNFLLNNAFVNILISDVDTLEQIKQENWTLRLRYLNLIIFGSYLYNFVCISGALAVENPHYRDITQILWIRDIEELIIFSNDDLRAGIISMHKLIEPV
ncbi:hypothetical protein ACJX0J_015947 [Zea mays]